MVSILNRSKVRKTKFIFTLKEKKTMIRRLKKNIFSVFTLIITTVILMVPLTTYAAFTQSAVIGGNGVRLRKSPVNGTILELMYDGESILIDDEVYDPNYSAWIYVKRIKTGTKGWMEWSYFVHQ